MVKSVTRVTVSRQRLPRPSASQTTHGVSSRHCFFFFVFIGNAVYVNSPQRYFPLRTVQAV